MSRTPSFTRRDFLATSAAVTGAALLTPTLRAADAAVSSGGKRTAADQVPLGKTGIMLSRVGIGTGSANGAEQTRIGKEGFTKLVHYAFDNGITYIDSAKNYHTFDWIGDTMKGLPREKIFLQSKYWPQKPDEDYLAIIDSFRSTYKTDYIDSLLVHCRTKAGWTDEHKRMLEALNEAKEKKWIRAKGVSCHALPALKDAAASDWTEVHLVRVNPMGAHMDTQSGNWGEHPQDIQPVLDQIKVMHDKGHGVIGMKICGNGDFKDPEQRRKSIKFAMDNPNIDAIVIGMVSTDQVDENIKMVNEALAAA